MGSLIQQVNITTLDIWETYSAHEDFEAHFREALLPMQYPEGTHLDRGLLLIGFNPSFSYDGLRRSWNRYFLSGGLKQFGDEVNCLLPNKDFEQKIKMYFGWRKYEYKELELRTQLAKHFDDPSDDVTTADSPGLSYFKPIRKISRKLFGIENGWSNIDLFLWRGTNQKAAENVLLHTSKTTTESGRRMVNAFGKSQMEQTARLFYASDPRIILVCNAAASQVLRDNISIFEANVDDSKFQQRGYDILEDKSGRRIPIFFSGMLSGQRALDLESLRRLTWHMEQALGESTPQHS